jgi:PIN domain nuclease of toxin-antitoxin system
MTGVVLDASAMIALLLDEPGAEVVLPRLATSIASTANWAEVAQHLIPRGTDLAEVRAALVQGGLVLVPLSVAGAQRAASLREPTRGSGLGLADRCCLALAAETGRVALTADTAWASAEVGADVELIR